MFGPESDLVWPWAQSERAGSGILTHPICDKIGNEWVAIKILDSSPELLGFQNAANLSGGVPTPQLNFFNAQKITKKIQKQQMLVNCLIGL